MDGWSGRQDRTVFEHQADKEKKLEGTAAAIKGLGDLDALRKRLGEDRSQLQLFVLKAKQEHEEKRETEDRKERREREYYHASLGEPCGPDNRFLVEGELGKGAFSTVFRCRDLQSGGQDKEYAVKFIRKNVMLRQATEKEVKLMRRLRTEASEKDPEGASFFLGLAGPEAFEHHGHLALVFHLQRCDLRSGLHRYGQGQGLPLIPTVQTFARNIFLALRALRKIGVVHSDLKPDNLLMALDKLSVKLSDFGSAMYLTERIRTDELQPRFYRAPEVILGQLYDTQIDIWSAGVTCCELATSKIPFQGRDNNGMLHEMLKTLGAFPVKLATAGDSAGKHFTADGGFKLRTPGEADKVVPMSEFATTQALRKMIMHGVKPPTSSIDAGHHRVMVESFIDLMGRCLSLDPAKRCTPEAASASAFFKNMPRKFL